MALTYPLGFSLMRRRASARSSSRQPNTVASAVKSAASLGVYSVSLHLSGGAEKTAEIELAAK